MFTFLKINTKGTKTGRFFSKTSGIKEVIKEQPVCLVSNFIELSQAKDGSLKHLFMAGGIGMNFWLLYRRDHLTGSNFHQGCLNLTLEHIGDNKYTPHDFIRELRSVNLSVPSDLWIYKHWDHFNPSIQKRVHISCPQVEN